MDVAQARAVLTLEDSQFQRGVKRADQQFDQLTKNVERSGNRASSAIGSALAGMAGRFAIGSAVTAGFGAAIKLAGDYEQALNVLGAVSGATAGQMRDLGRLAEQLGGDLSLPATSATDAALAMQELSKAGISVEDTMKAARGTLQLAAAAGIDAARAAEIQAAAMNAFKLSGDQATKVADQLAATANASAADITDLADAFKYAATAFAESGQSMTSLNAALGLLANAGIKGFTAGTGLRTMLASLTAPTKDATAVLNALGISIFDNQGKMRQLRDIIDQFSRKLGPVTQQQRQWALQQIFGREAANQANIVLTQGVQKYDAMAKAVTRSGAAADLAAARNKGLKGAFDGLRSAIETAAVKAVRPFQADLENLVRATARAVEAIGNSFPAGVRLARQEIEQGWGAIRDLFTSGFAGIQEASDAFFNKSQQGWSGYWSTLRKTVSTNVADIQNQIANIRSQRTGLDKFIDKITGKKPLSPELQRQGESAAARVWLGMPGVAAGVEQAQKDARARMTKVGEAFPQGIADGINKAAPKANAALAKLMKETAGSGKKTPLERQELALAQELAGARAQLAQLLAGEGNIAGEVAAKYNLLGAARRGELVTVLTRIDTAEKDAESLRKYRAELDKVNASIREQKNYHPLATLRQQFRPNISDKQLQTLENARQTEKGLLKLNKDNEEAESRRKEATQRMTEAVDAARRSWQAYVSVQKSGVEDNREVLALNSEWKKSYAELLPEQQAVIDQLFNYNQAVAIGKKATDDFTKSAEARIKAHKDQQEVLQREAEVMADFRRVMEEMRREQEQARTDKFAEGLRGISDQVKRESDEYYAAIESAAYGLQSVFGDAFLELDKGFSGFINSVIDGFSRMLQQLAAQYLASQLVKLLAKSLGVDIGGAGGSIIGTVFGGERAPARQFGGYVGANKMYTVGEQGEELFIPRTSGHIVPAAAGAGGPNVTINFNVTATDADSFRRNQSALMADAGAQIRRQMRRDGV